MLFGKPATVLFTALVSSALAVGAVHARPQACTSLEAEFIRLSNEASGAPRSAILADSYEQQLEAMRLTRQQAQRLGCGGQFAPQQQCDALASRLSHMQANLDFLQDERSRSIRAGSVHERLAAVRQSLMDLNCGGGGPSIQQPVQPVYGSTIEPGVPTPPGGVQQAPVYGSVPNDNRPTYMRPDVQPLSPQPSRSSATINQNGAASYTSYCVRTCDGYYFPVSSSTPQQYLNEDAALCSSMCPGTETQLYVHLQGEGIEQLRTPQGAPYTALPTAYQFKNGTAPSCSCQGGMELPQSNSIEEASLPALDGVSVAPDYSTGAVNPAAPSTLYEVQPNGEIQELDPNDLTTQSQQDEVVIQEEPAASEEAAAQTKTVQSERPAPRKVEPKSGPVRQVGPKFFADQ
ncbi:MULTISPECIES: DUF2865 domain-containing protein [Pseudovibrio]|uniref:DUF2865 domain-containing protein n=1 Tax=Stappiaceae TaxID=2821832 RepID=UPI002366D7A8|nr:MULTISPECIES: DUF2865 domain-containing protein [Pseudovibrio]MDD7908967.1 DUF2865 domain-containing protein [Pseudovibrio exalbescens]MDX5593712.1 DUF2865 domain-containing protein [Pseudovibrio sp. SPO723]